MGTSPATVTRLVLLLSLMTIFILHSASCSCYFDRELQGQWDYTDKMIKTVHFGSQSVSFYDNQFKEPWINMQCYKKAGNIYLLRAPRIFSLNVDALLCVRIFRKLTNPIIYEVDVPLGRKTFLEQIKLSRTQPDIKSDCLDIIMGETEPNHLYRKLRS